MLRRADSSLRCSACPLVEYGRTGDEAASCVKAFGMTRDALTARVLAFLAAGRVSLISLPVSAPARLPANATRIAAPDVVACALAETAQAAGNLDDARMLFEVASANDAETGCGIVGLVHLLMQRGDTAGGERLVTARLERAPSDRGALIARAEVLMGPLSPAGKPAVGLDPARLDQGRAALRQALAARPQHMLATLRLAASYRLGREDPAPGLDAVSRVLDTGTAAPEAWVVAGDLYRKAGNLHAAERALGTALRTGKGGAVAAEARSVLEMLAR